MLRHLRKTFMALALVFCISWNGYAQTNTAGSGNQSIDLEQGSSITFKANSVDGNLYQWFKDGAAIAGETKQTLKVTEAGTYSVQSFNNANCSSIMSEGFKVVVNQTLITKKANLTIIKKSEVRTTAVNDPYEYLIRVSNSGPESATSVLVTDVFPEGLVLKDITTPVKGRFDYNAAKRTLSWNIDSIKMSETIDIRFRAEAMNPGIILNTAKVTSVEEDVNPADNESTDKKDITDLIIPNVFTPNGDGVNERFEIKNLDYYKENEISIINRWGNSVYEKKNYENVWDGNGLDEGTYFFVLKVKNALGTWKAYKGYITLLRTQTQ